MGSFHLLQKCHIYACTEFFMCDYTMPVNLFMCVCACKGK